MFDFFDLKACGISAPWPGIEPAPPALEDKIFPPDHQGSTYIYWVF